MTLCPLTKLEVMKNRRILICGGGVAGFTLAYWLCRHGFDPTVVERGCGLRGGGHMIDFWGVGYDVAERMNVLTALRAAHTEVPSIQFVDAHGGVVATLNVQNFRNLLEGRQLNLVRSALESALFAPLGRNIVKFGMSVVAFDEDPDGVDVVFADGTRGRYDLVVGADGLRSHTRHVVFGPDHDFERFLGYYMASCRIQGGIRRSAGFRTHTVAGRDVGVYALGDGSEAVLFLFAADKRLDVTSQQERKDKLRVAFEGVGWRTPELLTAIDQSDDFYFDAVSQIAMPRWSRGRIALVGDACQCVSLIAGQGAALGMAGAYVLAGELKRSRGDHESAFRRYESFLKPHIEDTQAMARRFASSFVPSSKLGIAARNVSVKRMFMPLVSRWLMDRYVGDDLDLAAYA